MEYDVLDVARFWSRVDVKGIDQCWEWKGYRKRHGHGQAKIAGKKVPTHRFAYALVRGPPSVDEVVRHTCDNPPCCNPYHLVTGTHADNVMDRVARDRSAKGSRNGRARFTEDQIRAIRLDPRGNSDIAREFGVNHSTIAHIKLRLSWKHVE